MGLGKDNQASEKGSKSGIAPSVLGYLEFREFLKDHLAFLKANQPGFSTRSLARRLGLPPSSLSLLPAVINGRRNLTPALRAKLGKALDLGDRETHYFDLLVQFNQARDMEGKNLFFAQLARYRTSKARILQDAQLRFFSRWHHAAVRNYIGMNPLERNPAAIARCLKPVVTPSEVQESIDLLLKLELITRTANGYTLAEKHLFTPKDVRDRAARDHLVELTRMSLEILDSTPPDERQYNALMFTVSAEGFKTVKERIRSFMEELRDIIDRDRDEDRIYSLTLQLFPNGKLEKKGRKTP